MQYTYVHCPCGQLKGIETDEYALFKGIRYARAERWKAPQEVTQWQGIYDATIPGSWCFQNDSFGFAKSAPNQFYYDEIVEKQAVTYSEDCLNLNIWTPLNVIDAPVLVYFHGGSYDTGGGGNISFSGAEYCKQGIVFVSANYRLNAFSSAYGDGFSGNYGLQDQTCALKWLKNNIRAFGGNPELITIMGESAGAMSVQNLIFSPFAQGLFSGAIMLSGGGILPDAFAIQTPEITENFWMDIKQALGAESLSDLKSIPAEKLFCAWKETMASDRRYANITTPIIDKITIPKAPRTLVEERCINAVPTIIGVLSEDMWPHTLYQTALEWGLLMDCSEMPPVYGFYFDRVPPRSDYGAFHGCDIRYVFQTFHLSWRPYENIDYCLSNTMIDYFSNFIRTGNPNTGTSPEWTPITQNNHRFMHFGDAPCEMYQVPENHLIRIQRTNKPFPGM